MTITKNERWVILNKGQFTHIKSQEHKIFLFLTHVTQSFLTFNNMK
jgi:hypothetical protein